MTRRPTEEIPLGFDGPNYSLNLLCAHPHCLGRATEKHHLYRRSLLGGPFNWVQLDDGTQVGNLIGFCHEHHRQLTEDKAKLSLDGTVFTWVADSSEVLPLSYQPPYLSADEDFGLSNFTFENGPEKTGPVLDNECPACGRPLPHQKPPERPREPARPRRSWTITVPVDERENGAETLDKGLETARELLDLAGIHYSPGRKTKFFILATVLGLFSMHFRDIVSDG